VDAAGELAPRLLEGEKCYAGLDLSSSIDITALGMVFPRPNGEFASIVKFWMPQEKLKIKVKRDLVPYDVWAEQGYITLTPGAVVDYGTVLKDIVALKETYNIREIVLDRWNASHMATLLEGEGFTVVMFGQGFRSMSEPTKNLLSLILANKFKHGNNPVLNWMAGNVAVMEDASGNIKPDKQKSKKRIDGIVACVMGLARAVGSTIKPKESIYKTRGLEML